MSDPTPADALIHRFATFAGMPPDTDTPPVCGATLTRAYDWHQGPRRAECPECNRIADERRKAKP